MQAIIPKPVMTTETGNLFILNKDTNIYVEPGVPELASIADYLAERLRPATGFPLQVFESSQSQRVGSIYLTISEKELELGQEGYTLAISPAAVRLAAYRPAGIFWGIQTLRQMLPPEVESPLPQTSPWTIQTGSIRDRPRFEWRGAMLDVARHFFGVAEVKRYIDLLAYYKFNRFHLHLSDDQGWRIMIHSWPELALHGGNSAVAGDKGGYYSQAEYAEIAAYAAGRYIEVVPEIDLPGHTAAALASYPELNRDGVAPDLYTGIEVGFSSLCTDKEITYRFVDDVIREVAEITPGRYIHIGGDEAASTKAEDYKPFIERVQAIVRAHGKQCIGWEEIVNAKLQPGSLVQIWKSAVAHRALEQGARVILSPGSRTYLDMKYNAASPLGLQWAGFIDVQDAYNWDLSEQEAGVDESDILGVEAPLWSETLRTSQDIEYMALPRLPALAEIGWSPKTGRVWDDFAARLARHAPKWQAIGLNFYRSAQVDWR